MEQESLKSCPFCNSEAEITRYGTNKVSTQYDCTNCSCHLETGETFNHGAQWNTRASGWISVKDRLPEFNKPVLIWDKRWKGCELALIQEPHCRGTFWFWPENNGWNENEIDFWQPLPEPPKDE